MRIRDRIQRVGERGQITLPSAWRKKMGAQAVIVREKNGVLEISPLRSVDERDEEWVTVFDAVRDNKGKGMPIDEMIAKLKSITQTA